MIWFTRWNNLPLWLNFGEEFIITDIKTDEGGICEGYKRAHSFNPDCSYVKCFSLADMGNNEA